MKKIKRIAIILAIIFVFLLIINIPRLVALMVFSNPWVYNADFDNHKEAFEVVKDYVLAEGYDENDILSLSHAEFHFYDLYDFESKQYLDCPEKIRDALEEISKEAFYYKDSHFDLIRCRDGMVMFCGEGGPYRLVYSPNGNPRKSIKEELSEHNYTVKCKKIQKSWYHVSIN